MLENEAYFTNLSRTSGAMEVMRKLVTAGHDPQTLAAELHGRLADRFDKAGFALDLLMQLRESDAIVCPRYIREGLDWLNRQLLVRAKPKSESALEVAA